MNNDSEVERMADRLAELGYAEDAARETMWLMLELRRFANRMAVVKSRLEPVWKAVEWHDSGDWSEESVKDALEKYRGEEHV